MLAAISPFRHLLRSKRLLSKFHGPFFSTRSSWCFEKNLNWRMSLPTSTILKCDPILQTDLRVLFRARWFCCRSDKSLLKRLKWHSSNSSLLLWLEICMLSSSSLVSCRFCNPSSTACSIIWAYRLTILWPVKTKVVKGKPHSQWLWEMTLTQERNDSYLGENSGLTSIGLN